MSGPAAANAGAAGATGAPAQPPVAVMTSVPLAAAPHAAATTRTDDKPAQQKGRFAVRGRVDSKLSEPHGADSPVSSSSNHASASSTTAHSQTGSVPARRSYSISPAAAPPANQLQAQGQTQSLQPMRHAGPPSRAGSSSALYAAAGNAPGASPGAPPARRQFDVRPGSSSVTAMRNPAGGARCAGSCGGVAGVPAAWRQELPALGWLCNEWRAQQALIHLLMQQAAASPSIASAVGAGGSPPAGSAGPAGMAGGCVQTLSAVPAGSYNDSVSGGSGSGGTGGASCATSQQSFLSCRSEPGSGVSRTVSCESNCADLAESPSAAPIQPAHGIPLALPPAPPPAAPVATAAAAEEQRSRTCSCEESGGGSGSSSEPWGMEERLRRVQLEVADLTALNAELRRENMALLTHFYDARASGVWVRAHSALPPPPPAASALGGAAAAAVAAAPRIAQTPVAVPIVAPMAAPMLAAGGAGGGGGGVGLPLASSQQPRASAHAAGAGAAATTAATAAATAAPAAVGAMAATATVQPPAQPPAPQGLNLPSTAPIAAAVPLAPVAPLQPAMALAMPLATPLAAPLAVPLAPPPRSRILASRYGSQPRRRPRSSRRPRRLEPEPEPPPPPPRCRCWPRPCQLNPRRMRPLSRRSPRRQPCRRPPALLVSQAHTRAELASFSSCPVVVVYVYHGSS